MSNDYFKAQGWFKNYALNSQDSRGMFQRLVKEDEEAFKLASAETDKIKNMINKKYGSGTMKYGSEISQPSTRPDVIEIDAINAFMKRNPAAEGGRIPFKYAGPVKFENIIKPKIYEGNRFSKKLPKGTFTMRLYMGLDENGNRIEQTFTGTKEKLKKIFDKNNKARVKGDLPTMGDSKVYKVRQGKNKGKFAIKMPKEDTYSFYETEDLAEKHKTDYLNDPANKVGGDRTKKVIPPDGYVSGKDMLAEAKKKKIYVGENRQASNFADVFGFPKTTKDGQMFFDINKLNNEEAVDAILKSQVASGSATEEAKKKFPVKTKSELQKPRLEAIEAGGGVKKNDPYAGKRGSGIELGHTGNIFGTELITGDRLAYTPTEVNQLMGKEGNLDDKIRSVSAKIENIKASDKPANVKKDLLEQADNILIRLASQSQGFKKVTLSGGGTFGGDRLTIDPFNTYPGKTEKEIQKIQDAFFFEKNRKEVMKASKKIGKKEIKKITENINLKEIESYITDTTGKVKQPMFSSGFAGAYEMLSDDLKKITNTEGFKKFSKIAKTPGKFFGIGDVVLGYLDYKNNLGKYGDDERGRALSLEKAKQAMSFGLWKGGDRKYIEQLKETYIKNGGDDSVFDQVISLNKQNSELMSFVEKTKEQYQRELENEKTYGTAGGAAAIKFQLDVPSASNTLKNNLSVIKNKAENMDKDFTTFTETYKGTDLTQPSKDIKSAAFENLTKERTKAFDTKSMQSDPEVGPVWNYLRSNILNTQSIPRTITTAVDFINPFTPLPKLDDLKSDRARYEAQLKEMKEKYPREFYLHNLQRGMDPDNPITFDASMNLMSKPELGFNFSEGGITTLRSKYEYKK